MAYECPKRRIIPKSRRYLFWKPLGSGPDSTSQDGAPAPLLATGEQQVRLFHAVTSTTPDFVYVFDTQGRFQFANRRLLEVWGMRLEDVIGKTCIELGYEKWHHDLHMGEIATVIATKRSIKGEVPFKAPQTGIFGVYEYIFSPVIGPDGEVELIAGTTRDVTERKRTEEALRERKERYRELFNSMTEGFCVIEKVNTAPGEPTDFRVVEVNPEFPRQSGVENVLGRTIREKVPDAEEWIEIYDRAVRTGEPTRQERNFISRNRTLELFAYRVGDGSKNQVGVVFRDVTSRKRTEENLRRINDTFYHLIQNNPFGIYVIDADFRLRQVSLGAQKVFQNVRPLLGRDFAEVLRIIWNEPFATQAIENFRHTLESGEPFSSPKTIEHRHDLTVVEAYDWRIERLILPDGRYGVVCYFYDLSERQLWEGKLRQSEERFQLAARATNDLVWDWDLATDSIWWGEGLESLFGYDASRIERNLKWWREQVHPEDAERVERDLLEVVESAETFWRSEYRFRRSDGAYAYIFDRGYVMRDAQGKAVRMLGAMQDLTERKHAEAALAKAQEELQRHAGDLEQLVTERTAKLRETIAELEALSYSISHDMRAPLRAMQGFSQALMEENSTQLDQQGVSYLKRICAAAERLDALIQDVLLYTSVGHERLVLTPIQLESLLREVLHTYHPQQEGCVTIEPPFPPVLGHEAFLSQIVSNLLTNALKFVPKGQQPEVRIHAEEAGEFVKVWIEDKGIGIAPQHLSGIFQVFGRVYSEADYPGTGIGLAIVRRAVQRLGGEVGVESIPGKGSRFWFTLQKA